MIHYNYSAKQLEEKANELLCAFDPERLEKAKPIDVYAVIEKCLDVPYDWKYITPDQSILGLTVFKPGYLWVWPKPYYEEGMTPEKTFFDAGTIVIDSYLTELDQRGPENFTVMHEVFHQVLHKRCFAHSKGDYTHATTKSALTLTHGGMMRSSLEINESQANYCAACFLMPREPVAALLSSLHGTGQKLDASDPACSRILQTMAEEFSVSKTAMKIRLQSLNLMK